MASKPLDVFNMAGDTATSVQDTGRMVIKEMRLDDATASHVDGEQGWPEDQPQVRMSGRKLANLAWNASTSCDDVVSEAIRRLIRAEVTPGI